MENKNKIIMFSVVFLVIGIFIGWVFNINQYDNQNGMHMMPNGEMMHNVGMNMDDMMKGMMSQLEGKIGDEFDKEFLSEMIVHHEGAVEMAKAVLETSKRPELLQLASDIILAQTKEIEMMKNWQEAWFK